MESALRSLKLERKQAELGKRPWGSEIRWKKRATDDDNFAQYRKDLPQNGLLVRVSLFLSGHNDNPNNVLIGLKVVPQEPIMTFLPPWKGTSWHISVGFSNDDGSLSPEAIAFINKYNTTRDLRLKIHRVSDNAITYLAYDDPIMSDPIVQALHNSDVWYRDRPLHVTF